MTNYQKKIKGVSVVLTGKEETIFEYCTGVVDDVDTPNDRNKMFSIGSNTKLFTAIAIFQLVDQGKLDLDQDVRTYVKDFEVKSHQPLDTITIRNLLMHRSGLQGDDYSLFLNEQKIQEKDLLPALKGTYLCSKPDTMYAYSNLAYGLLGIVIERVSNETYTNYIQNHIFQKK